ncbi:NACHT domain protein [Fusarium beomiforme]|uniref:NACHT domain protein n=1 Tax=Fusarium beomiforme TaxID=44412 RepID=A0A9P5DWT3_9HYPO|nr:NACHT domain protein [Fusarium beomiforme]
MASNSPNHVSEVFDKAKTDFLKEIKDPKLRAQLQNATTIDDVWDYTEQLQKDQASNKRLRGMKKIGPYIERLKEYAGVIEVFVQAKPDILALIWGPIKLLLQMSSNIVAAFDAILSVMKDMGSVLPRFNEFIPLFKNNERMKYVLGLFFQDILDFYLVSLRFFGLTRWKIFFESLWPARRSEIQVISQNIEKHRVLLCNEITLNDVLEAHTARQKALEHYAETREFQEGQDFHSMETYIRPPSYDEDLDRIRNSRCEGTGSWLIQDKVFVNWIEGKVNAPQVLWLQGIPGADRDLRSVLCSTIKSTTKDLKRDLKGDSKFVLETFSKLLEAAGATYITIDGLDEVGDCVQQILLHQLLEMLKALPHVRVLISSRRVERIERLIKPIAAILPIDLKNTGCIKAYIARRGQDWLENSYFDSDACSEIRQLLKPLATKAEGMFLYARIVLQDIEMLQDLDSIRDQLKVLPESLDEAYERILQRIMNYPPAAQRQSKKILSWIACSPVEITRHEMEQALIIQPGQSSIPQVRSTLNTLPLCGPLVEIECERLKFVHFTVKEYLFEHQKNKFLEKRQALLEISTTCLTYLCSEVLDPELSDEEMEQNIVLGSYRLLNFAHSQWAECLRICTNQFQYELPSQFIPLLDQISMERSNLYYDQDSDTNLNLWGLARFESANDACNMISRCLDFRSMMNGSYDWRLDEGDDANWTDFDPTTITATTVRVYRTFESLICHTTGHVQDCQCSVFQKHYGSGIYRCPFLACRFHRISFKSQALRDHHIKHHDRPFKCAVQTCEYSTLGFSSATQCERHWTQCHCPSIDSGVNRDFENLSQEDKTSLLLDYIVRDQVDEVVNILPDAWDPCKDTIIEFVASQASAEMAQLLFKNTRRLERLKKLDHFIGFAIKANNLPVLKWALAGHTIIGWDLPKNSVNSTINNMIMTSNSTEAFNIWRKRVLSNDTFDSVAFSRDILPSKPSPVTESLLAGFWIEQHELRYISQERAARALVACGADVNFRNKNGNTNPAALSPLHCAARKTTAEAAYLAEYLLLSGADPNIQVTRVGGKNKGQTVTASMEPGAKGISKWLGKTWEELVKWAAAKRKESRKGEGTPGV